MKLPKDIDYTKYEGSGGMSTKHWGPAYWMFMFTSVMGRYPVKIDWMNMDDVFIANQFKNTFYSMVTLLPCVFCRESLNFFISELPIDEYLVGRIEMMYWIYLIKDKVNKKLIRQETIMMKKQKEEISKTFYPGSTEYVQAMKNCIENSFKTVPTPNFQQVLDQYESLRAVCSKEAKKCVKI